MAMARLASRFLTYCHRTACRSMDTLAPVRMELVTTHAHLPQRPHLRRLRRLRRATTNLTPFTGTAGTVGALAQPVRTEALGLRAVTPTGINTTAISKLPSTPATTRKTCGGSTFARPLTTGRPAARQRGGPSRLPQEIANAPARQAAPVSGATHADEQVTRERHSTPREEKVAFHLPGSVGHTDAMTALNSTLNPHCLPAFVFSA